MELEEGGWIDGGPPPLGVKRVHPLSDEAQIESRPQVAIDVVLRSEGLEPA
jgi:hypothetical protein